MADIELVIKISEETYEYWKNHSYEYVLAEAIKNGTPLPKGHGKIVDIDKLINSKCNECGHIRGVSCTIPCYVVRRMLDATTIIEADKAEIELQESAVENENVD